jgi:hypothetical protein
MTLQVIGAVQLDSTFFSTISLGENKLSKYLQLGFLFLSQLIQKETMPLNLLESEKSLINDSDLGFYCRNS